MLVTACMPQPQSSATSGDAADAAPTTPSPAAMPDGTFPLRLLAGPGTGPALYRGPTASDPAIGYISSGVAVEVSGPIEGDRVPVRIRGGLKVRGYMATQRLYARVQRRGRIRGTPIYVAGNDLVRVVGFEPDGRARVAVRARGAGGEIGEVYGGTYPLAGLGDDYVEEGEGVDAPGTPCTLGGSGTISVRERPGGEVIATFPSGTPCRNVREENGVFAVLVGVGPYVAGYVTERPVASASGQQLLLAAFGTSGGRLPRRLELDPGHALVRVAAGTRISFDATTIAVLDVEGRARLLERHADTGEADVFVAVDDSVAVRGLVPLTAISDVAP